MTRCQLLRRAGGAVLLLAALVAAAPPAGAQSTHSEPRVRPDGRPVGEPLPPAPAAPPEKPPLQVGEAGPDFTLSALRGKRVALADFRGQVVLLDFWATWCPTCQSSVRELKQLREDFAGRPFALVSVNHERDRVMLREFVAARQMDWPQAWDEASMVNRSYRVKAVPTYFLLGPDGRIVYIQNGWRRGAGKQLREAIGKALAGVARPPDTPATAAAQPSIQRR